MPITANWSDRLGIWFATRGLERDVATPKYWNGFGETLPRRNATVNITCEINFPTGGIHRQIEGAIARGEDRRLHILHRGGIGGGRKGIERQSFFSHFSGKSVTFWDGDRDGEAALVADLESSRMSAQLVHFVKDVNRIKHLVVQRDRPHVDHRPSTILRPFGREPESRAGYEVHGSRQPSADHDLVVNALAEALSRLGHKLGKDAHRDLVVADTAGLPRVLFEVKSGAMLADLYQAIGQLFFHSVEERKPPLLVLVSPSLGKAALRRIRRLGIRHRKYKFDRDSEVTFEGLTRLLRNG